VDAPSRSGEAGFTIIEIVVAAALFAVVGLALFEVVRQTQSVTAKMGTRHADYLEIRRFADRLRAEALTAEAIIAPSAACKEVQFYMRDPSGVHFWSYRLNGNEVDRYAAAGPLVPCATDTNVMPTVHSVASFTVDDYSLARLATRADTPFVNLNEATLPNQNVNVDLHVLDGSGAPVVGGNHTVEIAITNDIATYTVDLTPGVKPSGYDKVLSYTCGVRGGCGAAVPPPGLLAGADISDCLASDPTASQVAVPATYDDTVPCPPAFGSGLCTYVATWSVTGQQTFYYGAKPVSTATAARQFTDGWNIASLGSPAAGTYAGNPADVVIFVEGNPTIPGFTHQADAVAVTSNPANAAYAAIRNDRSACSAVSGEGVYHNV
jgi:hypothetical protein